MTERLLIANRGEIAVRIAQTARRLGITTIGVYSALDRFSRHLELVDEAVPMMGGTLAETYLSIAEWVRIATQTRATLLHPGYGLLSESSALASAVQAEGVRWVGPPADVIERLGSKVEAKRLARSLKIPTLDTVELAETDSVAEIQMRFPALIKAAAGGGGRGMRRVEKAEEFAAAALSARREALSAFKNGTLFVEPFIHSARHLEVQLLADQSGNVIAFPERECSLQRRYQKIIEESPAPTVSPEIRANLKSHARALFSAAKYQNAGTAEFLLLPNGELCFIEVNTRLQVEHPVTEMVTGVDLVEHQLRIALEEPLSIADPSIRGTAVEARLCAEDPSNHFLPQAGELGMVEWPLRPNLRIDTAVRSGDTISTQYDSLIAKLIAWGPTRHDALKTLRAGLMESVILGVPTNRELLIDLLADPNILAGAIHTQFLDSILPTLLNQRPDAADHELAAIAALGSDRRVGAGRRPTPWESARGWRGGA